LSREGMFEKRLKKVFVQNIEVRKLDSYAILSYYRHIIVVNVEI
jgi:hypothetical protein